MAAVHTMKLLEPYFHAVRSGEKTFEVREAYDLPVQKGDTARLAFTYYEGTPDYDRILTRRVGFVLAGGQFGLEPGAIAFSLLPTEDPDSNSESG